MEKNILQLLEKTAEKNPEKIIFGEEKIEITYNDFVKDSKMIGSYLAKKLIDNCKNKNSLIVNKPIIIFIDKTINCLKAMFGTLYSGNFYTIIDTKSPKERAKSIIETLNASVIITDRKNKNKLDKLEIIDKQTIIVLEDISESIDDKLLEKIRNNQIDTDTMYVLFTSGSTGIPKGTVINHRAVIAYTSWVKETFDINEKTIWGSQTPFYFSMSITDVFSTIISGATLYIIPKMYFSFPVKLFEFLNEKKINTIYWVPSALCIIANLKALDNADLPYLKKVLFAGEVMPVKQLNMWMDKFKNAIYANLFGPTETTDICSYYVINRKFNNDESIPIGKNCDNCNLIVVDENNNEITPNDIDKKGELLVRGSFLASGYYNNEKKTNEVFVQNPLNKSYREIVYKTGDIVKYNKYHELIYVSRKDYQIKHMGYRIELGEIEKNIYGIDGIILCACVYDDINSKIVLYYQAEESLTKEDLAKKASEVLLPYMRPNEYIKLDKFPYNANGKIDRKELKKRIANI